MASGGGEAESHHGVACGDGEVFPALGAADVGEAIWRAGAQAAPGLDFSEVAFMEGGEVVGHGADDAFDAAWIDGFVYSCEFHRAAESEGTIHGGDGEAGFGADAAKGGKLAGILEGQAVAFAGLHGEFQLQ